MSTRYVTIQKFADLSGYTASAVEAKIHDGTWLQDKVWLQASDGRNLIDIEGYEEWVQQSQLAKKLNQAQRKTTRASPGPVIRQSKSYSHTEVSTAGNSSKSSPTLQV